jgi:UDP-glucuronate 4-epimerase
MDVERQDYETGPNTSDTATVLVTGAAGFIGARLAQSLLSSGIKVVGVDNLNKYYDVRLKHWRLEQLVQNPNFAFFPGDIENVQFVRDVFARHRFDVVYNLAARAGVRASLVIPEVYVSTNVTGCLNLLECARKSDCKQFVIASTSSLYAGQELPFAEDRLISRPLSPYAATKLAAEAMAYTYHWLYKLNVAVLRYFTVYGPAARPDMSVLRFIQKIDRGEPLTLFGDGNHTRDFTYVDDIVNGTVLAGHVKGYEIINLGGGVRHFSINELIHNIEGAIGKKAIIQYHSQSPADMKSTFADASKAKKLLNWQPEIDLDEGIARSVAWYMDNHDWTSQLSMEENVTA